MTLYAGGEAVAAFVARMRAEHGLPPKCADPGVLRRVARELAEDATQMGTPGPGRRKAAGG